MHLHVRAGRPPWPSFLQLRHAQEDLMSEMEMKTEAETEEFTDELSDEALDRAEGGLCMMPGVCR